MRRLSWARATYKRLRATYYVHTTYGGVCWRKGIDSHIPPSASPLRLRSRPLLKLSRLSRATFTACPTKFVPNFALKWVKRACLLMPKTLYFCLFHPNLRLICILCTEYREVWLSIFLWTTLVGHAVPSFFVVYIHMLCSLQLGMIYVDMLRWGTLHTSMTPDERLKSP